MAISHDVTTLAAADYSVIGTQNTSHTAGASARAAVVLVHQNASTADQISDITYNGVAMTRLRFDTEATEAGANYIYWLDGITGQGGAVTVAMTTTGTAVKRLAVSTMSTASNIKVSVGAHNSATSASGANPTVTLTGLLAAETYYSYLVVHSGLTTMTTTPGTGWTNIHNIDLGAQGRGMARRTAVDTGITSLAATWTAATADDYVISAVAFYEDDLQTLTATAIADSGGIGDPVLSTGPVTLTATGIADEGGVGTPVANVIQNLNAAGGIASPSALGTPVLNAIQNLSVSGIASGEAVGTPVANVIQNLNAAGGIAGAEAVGTPVVQYSNVSTAVGIPSSSAIGTPVVSATATMTVAGIATSSAVGTPVANVIQTLATAGGIATPSAVGTPQTSTPATLTVAGIATPSAVGTPVINAIQNLSVSGIASGSAIGTPVVNTPVYLQVASIDASTTFPVGTPTLSSPTTLTASGIATASAVSTPLLAQVEETWGFLALV